MIISNNQLKAAFLPIGWTIVVLNFVKILTIKAEIRKSQQCRDATFAVKLRFTKGKEVVRIPTIYFVKQEEITPSYDLLEGTLIKQEVDKLIIHYREIFLKQSAILSQLPAKEIVRRLQNKDKEDIPIDFFDFAYQWIDHATIKGTAGYRTAVNALKRYDKSDKLNINDINKTYIQDFITFLDKEREERIKPLKASGKYIANNRASTLYIVELRHLFNEAKKQYNNIEEDIIRVRTSPFDYIELPQPSATRKRSITPDKIKAIWKLPYKNTRKGTKRTCRYDLAKDCFILLFCLIGINSVDLYEATKIENGRFIYNRSKTAERRLDNARMEVVIPPIIMPLLDKYADKTGNRVFNFYKFYADRKAFNKGLKEIGDILKIDDLEFYAARHSWATIAINKVHIDKYTVHAALNHIDPTMRVTDIYIQRDFVNENKANAKVVKYVFGK